jgi:predicted aldo/keto reductase-like oxidoreductase
MDRREFIKNLTVLGVAAGVARFPGSASHVWAVQEKGHIPYRQLGSSGEKVSLVGVGGYHLGVPDEEESIRIIRTAIDNGVNFMDNCWDYNQGQSEIRMGKALRDGYRQKAFLMTKIDGQTGEAATKQLHESLKRLQTDTIDLLQFHEIIRMSDPDRIFASGGAYEAMLAAKKAGKIRYLGFTGHKDPEIHLKMLETGFAHDFIPATVQLPLNVMDAHYDSFEKKVLPVLVQRGIAPLAMKPMGGKHLLESKSVTPMECLHYAMNLPVAVVITGCDSMPILEQALTASRTFRPLSEQEAATLLAKTAQAAEQGRYELYKTTEQFDGTARNPEWLG